MGIKMSKIDEIRKEMVEAMKNKDKARKESLSMLLSSLKNVQIDKRENLTEEEENAVVKKEIRQTKETMESCPQGRQDIINECKARLKVLQEFAPEEMGEEQIKELLNEVLKEMEIEQPEMKDKGKIIKNMMQRVKGKADGKLVSDLVMSLFE